MAEFLIKRFDSVAHADSIKERRGNYKRGDIVHITADNHPWGSAEGMPDFVRVKIAALEVGDVADYGKSFERLIQYEIVGQNLSIDGFRITASAMLVNNITGEGKLTRQMVETFLNAWGATVFSIGDNAVTFDVTIKNALESARMWRGAGAVNVVEQSYTQATGIHRLSINYSAVADPQLIANMDKVVISRGGTIISNDPGPKIIIADFNRADARTLFQADVKQRIDGTLVRRRFCVSETGMQTIEAAGGIYTATLGEFQAAVKDKIIEAI